MKLDWQISHDDVARVKALVSRQKNNALVQQRRTKNLAKTKPKVERNNFWCWMVRMRLTSIQRAGPNSPVAKFNRSEPFPLSYMLLCDAKRPEALIAEVIKNARGIRFTNTIPRQLAANFDLLQNGEWPRALKECNRLLWPVSCAVEKEVQIILTINLPALAQSNHATCSKLSDSRGTKSQSTAALLNG